MNKYISNLIELGAIVGGRMKKVDGFTIFERLPLEELQNIPVTELAFASMAMGRAIFTINENGTITNHKGVDSHLSIEESASMSLVKADAVYYSKDSEDYISANFPVNLVIYPGARPDVRLRGLSPLEDLEEEADINFRMQGLGIKLPKITSIREFTQEFCEKFGLPLKIDGDFKEFTSEYKEENDERKQRLSLVYGKAYTEELISGKRPERLSEYFRRIEIENNPNIMNFLKEKGKTFEEFIHFVDNYYSLGQRYGQADREIESPFRVADIEYYTKQGNVEILENIIAFTEDMYPDRVPFENYFATQMGINLANMMNNGWSCTNFGHRQDYSLTGEMCDDSYAYVPEKLKRAEKLKDENIGKMMVSKSDTRLKFFLQTYLLSSNIKVLQDEMALRGKSKEEIDSVLIDFLDNFTQNLDLEKVSLKLSDDISIAQKAFEILIRTPKNMQKLLSFKPDSPDKPQYDEGALLAHEGNNAFYDKVSQGLADRLGIQRTFINQTTEDIKGVNPYEFLEDR